MNSSERYYGSNVPIKAGPDIEVGMLGEIAEGEIAEGEIAEKVRMTYEEWSAEFGQDSISAAQVEIRNNYATMVEFLRKNQPEEDGLKKRTEFIKDLQPALQEKLFGEFGRDIRISFLTAVHSKYDYMGVDAVFSLNISKGEKAGTHHLLWGLTIDPDKHNPNNKQSSALPAHLDFLFPSEGWIRPKEADFDYEKNRKKYDEALDYISELMLNEFRNVVLHKDDGMIFTDRRDVREDAVREFQFNNRNRRKST